MYTKVASSVDLLLPIRLQTRAKASRTVVLQGWKYIDGYLNKNINHRIRRSAYPYATVSRAAHWLYEKHCISCFSQFIIAPATVSIYGSGLQRSGPPYKVCFVANLECLILAFSVNLLRRWFVISCHRQAAVHLATAFSTRLTLGTAPPDHCSIFLIRNFARLIE
jgi:hypothetical protein